MKSILKKLFIFVSCAAALVSVCACQPVGGSAGVPEKALYINEVVTSNSLSLTNEFLGSPDWIELYNGTDEDISLDGCYITDNIKKLTKWAFPDVTIKAGEYMTVFFSSNHDTLPDDVLCASFGISKGGDTLYLIGKYYDVLQKIDIPALETDVSWARRDDGTYGYCGSATPNAYNSTSILDTLADVSVDEKAHSIIVSEVMPINNNAFRAADGGFYPWVELYNPTGEDINVSSLWISEYASDLNKWQLPEKVLAAGEYMIVFLSGQNRCADGEIHAPFKLSEDESGIYVSTRHGNICSSLEWALPIPAGVCVVADGYTAYPTPLAKNSEKLFTSLETVDMDASSPVRINEVLPKNRYSAMDKDGDRSDWVELHNASSETVNLGCYYLSDDESDPYKWGLPNRELAAGEYILIFLSGKDITDGEELHASFSLSTADKQLMLTCVDGMRRDTVYVPEGIGDNVSIGKNADGEQIYYGQPTPGAKNSTKGFSSVDLVSLTDMGGLYISEVATVHKPKSGADDWIELHNASGHSINLSGYGLAVGMDGEINPLSGTIDAGGYLLVYAASAGRSDGKLCIPENLGVSGETIVLYNADGVLMDILDTGVLRAGMSSGRIEGDADAERIFFSTPTPMKKNGDTGYTSYTSAPVFSVAELYHTEKFELEITCSTQGATIYYTTDGSEPDTSSRVYNGAITIEKNTPVSAVAVCDGKLKSDIAVATYLFETPHTLPVVCLTCDPDRFSEVYSVTERKDRVERGAYISYYETDGMLGVSFPCGIRANGSSTLTARQKSLAIKLRGGYGRSEVTYPFFGEYEIKSFSNLLLRNSGQDRWFSRMKDSLSSLCVEGMNIDNFATRPVIAYINGKYWGIYDFNEDHSADYLEAHYGADADNIDYIRRNAGVLEGSNTEFKRVRAYALANDLSNQSTYEKFTQWVDVDYFTDYLIAQTYFRNGDMFNQKYWRSRDYAVKWRPVYYDLDFGFSGVTGDLLSSYFRVEGVPSRDGSLTNMDIYVGLRKNKGWREQFAKRYVWVLYNHLTPERINSIIDEYYNALKPEMQRHISRWGEPKSMSYWEGQVRELKKFANTRRDYALRILQRQFDISDATMKQYIAEATGNP